LYPLLVIRLAPGPYFVKSNTVNLKSLIAVTIFLSLSLGANAQDFQGIRDLVKRRAPWLNKSLILKKDGHAGTKDAFTLSAAGGKVTVTANSPNAAAFGVHWYLKYYCHRSISHMGDNMGPFGKLPMLDKPVHIEGIAEYRYALNYCTYNYTMSFYNWSDWQRELDYMALNGVNLMLIANGQEAVWETVLDELGYNQKQIDDFITGPAFNAWWLMGNIQGWGGPMTRKEIAGRAQLVQQMIQRMKELGIEPVMPAFFGMVPSSLKNKFKAHIVPQGNWIGFKRPDILDPSDSLFKRISALFYGATKKLYGKDIRFFSGDPFHEGGKHGDINIREAGIKIQEAMQSAFPGSVWVLQGWQANPGKDLISGVNKKDILIQELFGENTKNWEDRQGYEGTPFIWCTVTNFGERPGINGKLQRFADEIHRVRSSPYAGLCKGVGIMPEGINNNPVVYELMLELGWHKDKVDVNRWIKDYIYARYGKIDPVIKQAWHYLLESVYSSNLGYAEGPPENILCARPGLHITSVSSWGSAKKKYHIKDYKNAVALYVKAWPDYKDQQTYRIDLVSLLIQQLGTEADSAYAQLVTAYNNKDIAQFNEASNYFLSLFDKAEAILESTSFYQLSTYARQALDLNKDRDRAKNNVQNLLMLNTYWGAVNSDGDALHEYAYKEWAPMMETFYKARWILFFNHLKSSLEGKASTPVNYYEWERDWVNRELSHLLQNPQKPNSDPQKLGKLAVEILSNLKY